MGWEDPMQEGMANHSSILTRKITFTGSLVGYRPWSPIQLDTTEVTECACAPVYVAFFSVWVHFFLMLMGTSQSINCSIYLIDIRDHLIC